MRGERVYNKHSSAKNCNANGFFIAVSAYHLLTGKARSLSVSGCEAVGYVLGGTCLETGLCRILEIYMPVTLTCDNCGKQFSVPPSRAKSKTHFCSLACMSQFNNGDRNPNWKGGLVVSQCRNCGAEIQTKPSHVKKGEGTYCSRTCKAAWISKNALGYDPRTRVIKQCQVCGKDVPVKPSHIATDGTYCSRECMATAFQKSLTGRSNPNYRHGKTGTKDWVRAHRVLATAKRKNAPGQHSGDDIADLMRHQGGECAMCHCDITDKFHVDHRIPLSRGGHNNVGNLQLLCPKCNLTKHARFIVEVKYGKKARRK